MFTEKNSFSAVKKLNSALFFGWDFRRFNLGDIERFLSADFFIRQMATKSHKNVWSPPGSTCAVFVHGFSRGLARDFEKCDFEARLRPSHSPGRIFHRNRSDKPSDFGHHMSRKENRFEKSRLIN